MTDPESGASAGVPEGETRPSRRLIAALLLALLVVIAAPATAAEAKVRAILFFMPGCPACHHVIEQVLPPLFAETGGEPRMTFDETLPPDEISFYLWSNGPLEILLVDVTVGGGDTLFYTAGDTLGIQSQYVPRLVVGDDYFVGSVDIEEQLTQIVVDTMSSGGVIEWPAFPGVETALASATATDAPPEEDDSTTTTGGGDTTTSTEASSATTSAPTTTTGSPGDPDEASGLPPLSPRSTSVWDRFRQDTAGNSIAVAVLALMIAALIGSAVKARRPHDADRFGWEIPILAVAGLAVASYLAFVEVGGSEAVCGPVGDCNTVQQSSYARLFGIVPVGVLGVVGYIAMIVAWSAARFAARPIAELAGLGLVAAAVIGTLLSVYLTFLEPFVIGATCMWCIASALLVTAIMWRSVAPGRAAWFRMRAS